MKTAYNSDVRRLLVITYHFPPDGAIGGQRWAGLSKYLARLGWEVHIITAAAGGPQQPSPGVHQHFCCRRRTLNDVYKTFAHRLRQRSNGDGHRQRESQVRPRSLSPMRPIAALRRIVGSSMYLPDNGRGWVSAAASAGRALLREQAFDVVITSGPPHSAHFAGLAATLGRNEQFWIDMRDPWSLTHKVGPGDDWLVHGRAVCAPATGTPGSCSRGANRCEHAAIRLGVAGRKTGSGGDVSSQRSRSGAPDAARRRVQWSKAPSRTLALSITAVICQQFAPQCGCC